MSHILHIDVSPRGDRSVSRRLGKGFVDSLKTTKVVHRDGGLPIGFMGFRRIEGAGDPGFGHEGHRVAADIAMDDLEPDWKAAIKVSDELVDELVAADKIVISTPMFNLSVPAALKAWIDQIVRVGRTFTFADGGLKGLLAGKKAVIIITSGSPLAGTPYDFEEPYLRGILGFIGITDVTFVRAQGFSGDDATKAKAQADAEAELAGLAKVW